MSSENTPGTDLESKKGELKTTFSDDDIIKQTVDECMGDDIPSPHHKTPRASGDRYKKLIIMK